MKTFDIKIYFAHPLGHRGIHDYTIKSRTLEEAGKIAKLRFEEKFGDQITYVESGGCRETPGFGKVLFKKKMPCQTGKFKWEKKSSAERAAKRNTDLYKKLYRTYRCEFCRKWHLTTQLQKISKVRLNPADR